MSQSTPHNPRRIAIIGAGISGIATAAHLLQHNAKKQSPLFEVTIFERSNFVGGVWEYDDRKPIEPAYPSEIPPAGNPLGTGAKSSPNAPAPKSLPNGVQKHYENKTDLRSELAGTEDYEAVRLLHAPPGPAYKGLKNNVPTSLMYSTLQAWPEGTEEYVNHSLIAKYIHDLAANTGADKCLVLDTSVEGIWKEQDRGYGADHDSGWSRDGTRLYNGQWTVQTKTLLHHSAHNTSRSTNDSPPLSRSQREPSFAQATHNFDAVVVAAGHYHLPRLPDIPGLDVWRDAFPGSVTHAKRYREPAECPGKRVLIIGSSASSHDISKELTAAGKIVYVSSRGGEWDVGAPEPAIRIGAIEKFEVVEGDNGTISDPGVQRGCGVVRLKSGDSLRDIDHVILATGYLTSYPFLGPRLQNPEVAADQADEEIIVTKDGLLTHNLHKDLWYIPDPSLVFVGVVFHVSTFSMYDFQASVVARVLSGQARLPSREEMRSEYNQRKKAAFATSSLRAFHSLMGQETEYIAGLLAWVNADAQEQGIPEMTALSEKWYARSAEFKEWVRARRAELKSVPTSAILYGPRGRVQREDELRNDALETKTEEQLVPETTGQIWKTGQADDHQARMHKRLESEFAKTVAAL